MYKLYLLLCTCFIGLLHDAEIPHLYEKVNITNSHTLRSGRNNPPSPPSAQLLPRL